MDIRGEITFAVTFIRDGVLPRATTIFFYFPSRFRPAFPFALRDRVPSSAEQGREPNMATLMH
jgi:hypothetical protein